MKNDRARLKRALRACTRPLPGRLSEQAFTLLELLVVITVLGVLAALMLTAVQHARESARRLRCQSNMRQIGNAIHSFESTYKLFPAGGEGRALSFLVSILPFVDRTELYEHVDFSENPMSGRNQFVAAQRVSLYHCPSGSHIPNGVGQYGTSYVGNSGTGFQAYGYNGVFQNSSFGRLGPHDVFDGLSNTAAASESLFATEQWQWQRLVFSTPVRLGEAHELDDFAAACRAMQIAAPGSNPSWRGTPWTYGDAGRALYNHVLTPNCNSCTNRGDVQAGAYTATSYHPSGVNVLFADGSVAFIANDIGPRAWRAIGSRGGTDRQ